MVENKIVKEKEPEVKIPIPEIDISNVKIWSRKTKCWYPIKPKELVLFTGKSEKCKKCGFILKHCQCGKRSQTDDDILELKIALKLKMKFFLLIYRILHKRIEKEILYLKVLRDYHESKLNKYYKKYEFHQKKLVKFENQLNNTNFLPEKML